MSKKIRATPSKAKNLVMQQCFRSRQERPLKGKGSYNRKASRSNYPLEAFFVA